MTNIKHDPYNDNFHESEIKYDFGNEKFSIIGIDDKYNPKL